VADNIDYVWENTVDSGRFHCGVIPVNDGYAGKLVVTVVATGEVILDEVVSIAFAARFGPDVDDVNTWQDTCIPAIDAWLAKGNGET
jgi:hypothetical protein